MSEEQLFFFYTWQWEKSLNQLPGYGKADFVPCLNALADINFSRYVNPFMHHHLEPDAMAEALKIIREYILECHLKI